MEKEVVKELSFDDLKLREIADYYLDVQANTEPLTQLTRFNPRSKKIALGGKIQIDIKCFFLLIVQFAYLMFTCRLKKINIFVGAEFLARIPNRTETIPYQEVYIEYILDKQFNRMPQAQQELISKKFRYVELTKSQQAFGDIVCEFIDKIGNMIRGLLEKVKNSPSEAPLYRQMEGLRNILQKFILPQLRSLSPQILMLCLQESELFRENSLLLKVFNNSLFVSIRYFGKCRGIYNQLMAMEESAIINRQSKTNLLDYIEKVEFFIEDSFKLLLIHNIISTEHSLEELQGSKDSKKYVVGSLKGTTVQNRKYTVNIFVKERPLKTFSQETFNRIEHAVEQLQFQPQQQDSQELMQGSVEGLRQKDKNQRNLCVVEFHSSKNMICVKYVTNIELTLQNTDLLMFHCNSMSYSWNSLSLQFYEKNISKNKKKQKYLAFKTSTYINSQERIIFKILTMIDLLIVYAKIVEPQLRKKLLSSVDEYDLKNADINEKCEHLKNLFIKKIESCYLDLQNGRNH